MKARVPSAMASSMKPSPWMATSNIDPVCFMSPGSKWRTRPEMATPEPRPERAASGPIAAASPPAPSCAVTASRVTRSVKLTRAFLKPGVSALARLLAMLSTLACWACIPVALM